MPRDRDTEIHRDTQKHIDPGTERERWGAERDSKAGRGLKETSKRHQRHRDREERERGERVVQETGRQGETNRGREMSEIHGSINTCSVQGVRKRDRERQTGARKQRGTKNHRDTQRQRDKEKRSMQREKR